MMLAVEIVIVAIAVFMVFPFVFVLVIALARYRTYKELVEEYGMDALSFIEWLRGRE